MTNQQLQDLIAALTAGGAGGATGTISTATLVGPMGACTLGNDKLKRPNKWRDWLREAENKMRFAGITADNRKWAFLRGCVGAELTELWDKEVRVKYEATGEAANRVEADTYN